MPVKKPESIDAPIESHAQYIFEHHYLLPFFGAASAAYFHKNDQRIALS